MYNIYIYILKLIMIQYYQLLVLGLPNLKIKLNMAFGFK